MHSLLITALIPNTSLPALLVIPMTCQMVRSRHKESDLQRGVHLLAVWSKTPAPAILSLTSRWELVQAPWDPRHNTPRPPVMAATASRASHPEHITSRQAATASAAPSRSTKMLNRWESMSVPAPPSILAWHPSLFPAHAPSPAGVQKI